MKKLLGILVLGLLLSSKVYAEKDFKYKSTVLCGPKKVKRVDDFKETKPYYDFEYYYIYFDKAGDFVIFNWDTEYTSFAKRYYSHLYNQNGKATLAILNIEFETMYKFQLFTEWKQKKRRPNKIIFLNFDKKAMTYSVFVIWGDEKGETTTGACWIVS